MYPGRPSGPVPNVSSILAVADLPSLSLVGRRSLIRHPWVEVGHAVAESPSTPGFLVDELVADKNRYAALAALQRTTSPREALRSDMAPIRVAALARNPHAPAELFSALAPRREEVILRSLLFNPSLPRERAEQIAQQWHISQLFTTTTTVHAATEVGQALEAHPCLGEIWALSPHSVARRMVARSPEITSSMVEGLLQSSKNPAAILNALALNPFAPLEGVKLSARNRLLRRNLEHFLAGRNPQEILSDASFRHSAAAWGSPTLDVLISRSPGVTRSDLVALLMRTTDTVSLVRPPTKAQEHPADGDVLARCANALGSPSGTLVSTLCSSTKVESMLRHSTAVARAASGVGLEHDRGALAQQVMDILGSDPVRWETFVGLSQAWEGTLPQLLEVVSRL